MAYRVTLKDEAQLYGKPRARALRAVYDDLPPAWRHMMVVIVPEDRLYAFMSAVYWKPPHSADTFTRRPK